MYFISSGAVEVAVEPKPVHLGSDDFFGEIARSSPDSLVTPMLPPSAIANFWSFTWTISIR